MGNTILNSSAAGSLLKMLGRFNASFYFLHEEWLAWVILRCIRGESFFEFHDFNIFQKSSNSISKGVYLSHKMVAVSRKPNSLKLTVPR